MAGFVGHVEHDRLVRSAIVKEVGSERNLELANDNRRAKTQPRRAVQVAAAGVAPGVGRTVGLAARGSRVERAAQIVHNVPQKCCRVGLVASGQYMQGLSAFGLGMS